MNKNEKLLRAIGGVGEDLIARADEPVTKTGDKVWYRIAALAACAALVIGVGALVLPKLNLGAKTEAPAAEAPRAEAVTRQEARVEEPKAEESAAEEAPAEAGGLEPAEEPRKEETSSTKPAKEETPKAEPQEETPEDEAPEEKEPEKEPEEDDTPDPDPLQNLDLFDQKYHFVSKSRSKSRDEIFTDDAKIGKWYTELFTGEQIYRYGEETVTGTDGNQYPFRCVVIYGKTAAIYEYSEEQDEPSAQEETPAEQTLAEETSAE